ncbi:hypothetical protein LEP1GSC088_0770 [Leptospira interrogans str. L1207]|nr:hypothetical protein LEP1GSC088_0770 [Leptospira interrogans str. L1207]
MIAIAMILGRFGVILPVLVIAGSLAQKKKIGDRIGRFFFYRRRDLLYFVIVSYYHSRRAYFFSGACDWADT